MRRRSPSRWLAPLALVTAAIAVYAVVHQSTDSGSGTVGTSPATATTPRTSGATTTARSNRPRTYTVKGGDVLSAIAIREGTTVAELQRLNPSVDAAALHPGQRLKLPR